MDWVSVTVSTGNLVWQQKYKKHEWEQLYWEFSCIEIQYIWAQRVGEKQTDKGQSSHILGFDYLVYLTPGNLWFSGHFSTVWKSTWWVLRQERVSSNKLSITLRLILFWSNSKWCLNANISVDLFDQFTGVAMLVGSQKLRSQELSSIAFTASVFLFLLLFVKYKLNICRTEGKGGRNKSKEG